MQIHISRAGQQYGPYPEEQARQMLAAGQLLVNDYAMREGDTQWVPLEQLLGAGKGTMENYNRVAETVGGLSLRKKDNMIQAIVVVGGTALCSLIGVVMGPILGMGVGMGLVLGLLAGLVLFGLGSGVVLMVMRLFKKGK